MLYRTININNKESNTINEFIKFISYIVGVGVKNIWTYEGRGNGGMEETAQRGAKCSVLLTQYRAGDKMEKNEMGWACGEYG